MAAERERATDIAGQTGQTGQGGTRRRTPGWGRWFVPLHLRLYRATGGVLGHWLWTQRALLLTTTGRKTGIQRTQPISYFARDEHLILVASNWGNDQPPSWYLNLLAQPRVRVQRGGDVFDALARTATPDERARLWPFVVSKYPPYKNYQAGTDREIPLVLLRRIEQIGG